MATWSLPIAKYLAAAQGDIEKAGRAVALDVFSRIIVRSPVDTGRFRGNWQIDIQIVPEGWSEQTDKSGRTTLAKARQAIAHFRIGNTISIRNNLPYAVALENGWSGQAPQGMVKVTLVEFGAIASAAVSRVAHGGGEQ